MIFLRLNYCIIDLEISKDFRNNLSEKLHCHLVLL